MAAYVPTLVSLGTAPNARDGDPARTWAGKNNTNATAIAAAINHADGSILTGLLDARGVEIRKSVGTGRYWLDGALAGPAEGFRLTEVGVGDVLTVAGGAAGLLSVGGTRRLRLTGAPVDPLDAATKAYVDAHQPGIETRVVASGSLVSGTGSRILMDSGSLPGVGAGRGYVFAAVFRNMDTLSGSFNLECRVGTSVIPSLSITASVVGAGFGMIVSGIIIQWETTSIVTILGSQGVLREVALPIDALNISVAHSVNVVCTGAQLYAASGHIVRFN